MKATTNIAEVCEEMLGQSRLKYLAMQDLVQKLHRTPVTGFSAEVALVSIGAALLRDLEKLPKAPEDRETMIAAHVGLASETMQAFGQVCEAMIRDETLDEPKAASAALLSVLHRFGGVVADLGAAYGVDKRELDEWRSTSTVGFEEGATPSKNNDEKADDLREAGDFLTDALDACIQIESGRPNYFDDRTVGRLGRMCIQAAGAKLYTALQARGITFDPFGEYPESQAS